MAIFVPGVKCRICGKPIQRGEGKVMFPPFLEPTHSLYFLSDGCAHEACFTAWPHREVFLELLRLRDEFHDAVLRIADPAEKKAFIASRTAAFREQAAALDPARSVPSPKD